MKTLLVCFTLFCSQAAFASELTDADALFAKQAYARALPIYTKLANAGNPQAQLRLGEMYWHGEAGAIDVQKAEAWFRKAAANGNPKAAAVLELMRQREARRSDIVYWTSKYDGADLKSGAFSCPMIRVPAVSKTNEEIAAVTARMTAWQDCYNGFVRNLNASSPLVTHVPPDVVKLFNQEELDRATRYLDDLQVRLSEDAKITAKLALADFAAWRSATDAYVTEHNEIVKLAPSADRLKDIEARKRNYAPGGK